MDPTMPNIRRRNALLAAVRANAMAVIELHDRVTSVKLKRRLAEVGRTDRADRAHPAQSR
jgi:hypothetical protein